MRAARMSVPTWRILTNSAPIPPVPPTSCSPWRTSFASACGGAEGSSHTPAGVQQQITAAATPTRTMAEGVRVLDRLAHRE